MYRFRLNERNKNVYHIGIYLVAFILIFIFFISDDIMSSNANPFKMTITILTILFIQCYSRLFILFYLDNHGDIDKRKLYIPFYPLYLGWKEANNISMEVINSNGAHIVTGKKLKIEIVVTSLITLTAILLNILY